MQRVITHPAGVTAGLEASGDAAADAIRVGPDSIESVIDRSLACTSVERLAVYSNAYRARLIECLSGEFATLATIVGSETFDQLASEYLQARPSTSYTLGELGREFPGYLARTRPPRAGDDESPDWADLVIDVATLDRCYAEVFDGPGEEGASPLAADAISEVPVERVGKLIVRPTASLRLLRFKFPVHELGAAGARGDSGQLVAAAANATRDLSPRLRGPPDRVDGRAVRGVERHAGG
ncbi:MAG: DNA-binding domain-containing protein [Planctomycetaceae bacterium]